MTAPSASEFAARLDHVLTTVPCEPASPARFSEDDVVEVLAVAVASPIQARSRAIADAWLRSARAADSNVDPINDRPALEMLGLLFRVPAEYFIDQATTSVIDARLELAAQANARRVRSLGPCRSRQLNPADAFVLHRQLLLALDKGSRRPTGTW